MGKDTGHCKVWPKLHRKQYINKKKNSTNLWRGIHGVSVEDPVRVLLLDLGGEEGAQAGPGATAQGVGQLEALETRPLHHCGCKNCWVLDFLPSININHSALLLSITISCQGSRSLWIWFEKNHQMYTWRQSQCSASFLMTSMMFSTSSAPSV